MKTCLISIAALMMLSVPTVAQKDQLVSGRVLEITQIEKEHQNGDTKIREYGSEVRIRTNDSIMTVRCLILEQSTFSPNPLSLTVSYDGALTHILTDTDDRYDWGTPICQPMYSHVGEQVTFAEYGLSLYLRGNNRWKPKVFGKPSDVEGHKMGEVWVFIQPYKIVHETAVSIR